MIKIDMIKKKLQKNRGLKKFLKKRTILQRYSANLYIFGYLTLQQIMNDPKKTIKKKKSLLEQNKIWKVSRKKANV